MSLIILRRHKSSWGWLPVIPQLSKDANCSKCGFHRICFQGTARIFLGFNTPWRLEDNFKWASLLIVCNFIGVYNAFNERVSGYGYLDDSHWPLKDDEVCISVANQEFSFTDQLNLGLRHLEIDLWNCFGKVRMSHGNGDFKTGRSSWDKELSEGMREISIRVDSQAQEQEWNSSNLPRWSHKPTR